VGTGTPHLQEAGGAVVAHAGEEDPEARSSTAARHAAPCRPPCPATPIRAVAPLLLQFTI